MLEAFRYIFSEEQLYKLLILAKDAAPLWVPVFLFLIFIDIWLNLKRREWIKKQGSVLLEIKLPRDILKGPAAMELVLHGFFEPVLGTLLDAYFKGSVRDWFSLEIISDGGKVRFFIWALPKWKKIVEARIYAQYPNVEVHEVRDYTQGVQYDHETMNLFGIHTALTKPDVYPIRTYMDYSLDKKGDEEEEKVDPLTPLLEWLGSLKQGERAWIQIMIQAHRKEGFEDARIFPKPGWQTQVKKEIQKIIKEGSVVEKEEGRKPSLLDLTKLQQEAIEAIQRSQDKLAYDTMMRCLYFAKKEDYNPMGSMGLVGSMRQFGSRNLNGIKPVFQQPENAYPWQDFRGVRKKEYRSMIFDAYKRRSIFNGIYKNWMAKPYVLNVEELATLFHFPGGVATTPNLNRIPSKKAEAPANLPI